MKRLIVEKINKPRQGRFGDAMNTKVVLKDIDEPKKRYYLNMDERWPDKCLMWRKFLKPGNILDCTVYSGTTISLFIAPKLVKEVSTQ